jgi:type IV pilus assembly protein PilC
MPVFQYEAMDAQGQEVKGVTEEVANEEEAQQTIRAMGYFVTKITVKKARKGSAEKKKSDKGKRSFALGGVSGKVLTTFTRQLSILQDAGLPILRSLRILEQQQKPGALKNALMDVCDEIEAGATLSEAMAKAPKAFDRLYVNMIKAGEAGGALEVILRRLAEFQEKSQALKRKVVGAMIYPVMVVLVAVGIVTGIMYFIVPAFIKIFEDFDADLPAITVALVAMSTFVGTYWYTLPLFPVIFWLCIKLLRKFQAGRAGWDQFTIKMPVFGQIIEKNIVARTTRTLGTLVSSGVPILEALNITRETAGNYIFENMYAKIYDAIREGESIARPMKEYSRPRFNPITLVLWFIFVPVVGPLFYLAKVNQRIVDDLVVNMVDVGEETGELDTMLYKVADTYDEMVSVLTESLTKLIEPLLIVVLGGAVGFIVVALFMPLIGLIEKLA